MQNRMHRTIIMQPQTGEQTEEQKHQLGTAAQAVEENIPDSPVNQVIGYYQDKLRSFNHPPSWYPVDPHIVVDDWISGPPITTSGTFTLTLPLTNIDRPILIQSLLAYAHPQCNFAILQVLGGDTPRMLASVGSGQGANAAPAANSMSLYAIAMVLYPNEYIQLTSVLTGAPTIAPSVGQFIEVMGLSLRGDQWRRI